MSKLPFDIELSVGARHGYDAYDDGTSLPWTQEAPIDDGQAMPSAAHHPFGFMGRPRDRDVNADGSTANGNYLLYASGGDKTWCFNLDDVRRTLKLPQVDPGGSLWYADVDDAYGVWDGTGNLKFKLPLGKTFTVDVGNGITVEVSSSGVNVKGLTPQAPMTIGPTGTPPTAVILGASAGAWGKPSTILFATA